MSEERLANRRAFSLLEVMIVIGIIAFATAVMLPTIASVRNSVGDLTCQNNIRQLLYTLQQYNGDNNGSMPYGFYYTNSDPVTWGPAVNASRNSITWISELDKYHGSKTYSHLFRCPQAQMQGGPHPVSYVMNMIVAVVPQYELMVGMPPRAQTRPPSVNLMLREGTALIWDTAVQPNWENWVGFIVGSDIDGQRFWQGAVTPQFRYFSPNDLFGQIPPGILSHNRPVRLNVGTNIFQNVDPPANSSYPYQGNLRFRHNNQTECNVGFSDGSVRRFTATIGTTNTVTSHDALRRYFMINWPPGVPPNPSIPSLDDPPPMKVPQTPFPIQAHDPRK